MEVRLRSMLPSVLLSCAPQPMRRTPLDYDTPKPARSGPLGALGCLGRGLISPVGTILCFLVTIRFTYALTERLFLSRIYGADRYAAGLRIVHKHYLSDGTRLPTKVEFWQAISAFLLAIPVVVTYQLLAGWLRLYRDEDWVKADQSGTGN